MRELTRYLKVWMLMAVDAVSLAFDSRVGASMFLTGKIIRFVLFLYFLYLLVSHTNTLAGYSVNQIIFFFLTFNLIDVASQFLFRGVYVFRPQISSGNFDFDLIRPLNPLFRALLGRIDILDFITLVPLTGITAYVSWQLSHSLVAIFGYWLLVVNGLLIAFAFHVFVLGLAIITLEIDHAVMIYRDFTSMGKIPVDVYKEPLRTTLNFLLVGVVMTLPVKFLIGMVPLGSVVGSMVIGGLAVVISVKYWDFALSKYASASS